MYSLSFSILRINGMVLFCELTYVTTLKLTRPPAVTG